MYADRIAAGSKRSIKDRLNIDFPDDIGRGRKPSSKRQRQNDDKWKRDLFDDDRGPETSKPRVGPEDLRFKLRKKASEQAYQDGKDIRVRDLREKLSGTMQSQPPNLDLPKAKPVSEVARPIKKSAPSVEVPASKKSSPTTSRKKSQQKSKLSVDGFIRSLGLEKYLILFQAEEIDMTILTHMTDDDLKALGIPMGPRKKILLALESNG